MKFNPGMWLVAVLRCILWEAAGAYAQTEERQHAGCRGKWRDRRRPLSRLRAAGRGSVKCRPPLADWAARQRFPALLHLHP